MAYLTRRDIGLRPSEAWRPFDEKKGVVFHHAGGALGIKRHEQCLSAVRSWQNIHMAAGGLGTKTGAPDIAYNLGACPHGYVLEMRGLSARSAANGSFDINADYAAIVYIGGSGEVITPEGLHALKEAAEMAFAAGFPRKGYGHRDFYNSACPGLVYDVIPQIVAPNVPNLTEASRMLNTPAVAIKATPDGGGYYILAADGGVFAFGNAPFFGSMGGTVENSAFAGMDLLTNPAGEVVGYWLLGADGGVFAFGQSSFHGSAAG